MASITASRGLTIGALSRRAGVKIETIRYYERIQLMQKPPRTSGGHRCYDPEHVDHLRFIRQARVLGFGIKAVRNLLALSVRAANSCAEAREIAAAQLADVRTKQHDLVRLEKILADTIAQCDARCCGPVAPDCPVFEMLNT
jgi:MerR family mercuric resistance operon transcriptional regulator